MAATLGGEGLIRPVALKVDVDTLRGTREGVPRLVELMRRLGVGGTFYFSLGPDHTGRALKRVFRRGFLGKVRRTNVAGHYGLKTLMYGVLLPGPHIGRRAGDIMRSVRDAGFEVGIHCYDHVRWQDGVAQASPEWTRREYQRAVNAFAEVFGEPAQSHAAAGWQINPHTLVLQTESGLRYASDGRGPKPFWPVMGEVTGGCLQIPTTLPTFDELIGVDGRDADAAAEEVLRLSRIDAEAGHVFTLHAELEGQLLLPQFEKLLRAWQAEGRSVVAMKDFAASLDPEAIGRGRMVMAELPGRSGLLATSSGAPL